MVQPFDLVEDAGDLEAAVDAGVAGVGCPIGAAVVRYGRRIDLGRIQIFQPFARGAANDFVGWVFVQPSRAFARGIDHFHDRVDVEVLVRVGGFAFRARQAQRQLRGVDVVRARSAAPAELAQVVVDALRKLHFCTRLTQALAARCEQLAIVCRRRRCGATAASGRSCKPSSQGPNPTTAQRGTSAFTLLARRAPSPVGRRC